LKQFNDPEQEALTMSNNDNSEVIAPNVAAAPNGRLTEITCVAGAIIAVAIGTLLFGGFPGIVPMFAALLVGLWRAMQATSNVIAVVLAHTPWTVVFDVLAAICLYCLCRVLRAGVRRRAYLGSFAMLATAWVLYALVLPRDADLQVEILKALAVGLIIAWPATWWSVCKMKTRGESHAEETGWGLTLLFAVCGSIAVCVFALAHILDSADTMPDVTQQVQAKHGAELERLGFEDVNRIGQGNDNNTCGTLTVVFHDGSQTGVVPMALASALFQDTGDEYRQAQPSCIGMRLRAGKLTVALPDPAAGARREDAVKAALDGADEVMVQIRQAHEAILARNSVSATWQTTAFR
jgi:hypothetical protein